MSDTKTYFAFGLFIQSEIELPGPPVFVNNPDVVIKYGEVPESLPNAVHKGVCFEAFHGQLLLKVPNIASFYISNGNKIIINKKADSNPETVRLFLLGSALGALLHQKGVLPIHASAVLIDNSAVLLAGVSGVGKSTLAAAFRKKGYSILTDDIAAIHKKGDAVVFFSGFPQLKLWKDAVKKLDIDLKVISKVREEFEKFSVPLEDSYVANNPVQVKAMFVLTPRNNELVSLQSLKGIEKFNALKNNTFRYNFIKGLIQNSNHFPLVTQLASEIKIYRLYRESAGFNTDILIETILQELSKR